jgi:hypothetical protein
MPDGLCFDFLWMWGTTVSIPWIVFWSVDHVYENRFIHIYELVKYPEDCATIGPKWLVKQLVDDTYEWHRNIWEPIWQRAFSCLK